MTAKHPYPAHVVEAVAKALWETAPASQVIGWDDLAPQDSQHSDYTSKANTALNALRESDNHEHTPTTTQIREDYAHLRYHFADGWSIGEERVQFDNWLSAEIAAAEQRGAIRALRDAATRLRDSKFANSVKPPSKKVQVKEADWLDALADRLEGDDEQV